MKSNSFGRSFTDYPAQKRKLNPRSKTYPSADGYEYADFLNRDPRALIAAFISTIDKIYRKPGNGPATKKLFDLRDGLGNACWPLVRQRIGQAGNNADEFLNRWRERLHPYAEYQSERGGRSKKLNFAKPREHENVKGNWYETLMPVDDKGLPDHSGCAAAIDRHLFEHAARWDNEAGGARNQGLIAYQADSIEKSLPLDATGTRSVDWSAEDEERYLCKFRPAEAIIKAAKEAEREDRRANKRPARLKPRDAGIILFDGYASIFGDGHRPPPRLELEAQKGNAGLLALHRAVQAFYKRKIKMSLKGTQIPKDSESARIRKNAGSRRQLLSAALPQTTKQLFALLKQRHDNSNTNRMIRKGRLLYYCNYRGGAGRVDPGRLNYWKSSAGQAEIKRSEAFVRVWRSAISQGARTLRSLAKAPDYIKDITDQSSIESLRNERGGRKVPYFDSRHTFAKFRLIFGRAADSFPQPQSNPDQLAELLEQTMRSFAQCRHGTFHFSTRQGFVDVLKNQLIASGSKDGDPSENMPDQIAEIFRKVLNNDVRNRARRLIDNLEAVHLHCFAGPQQMSKIWSQLNQETDTDIVLPKFHNVLGHMENLGRTGKFIQCGQFRDLALPPKPNARALEDPATLCRYATLKYLFEGPFRRHLQTATAKRIDACIKEILKRGAARARKANASRVHKDLIESKAGGLPRPNGDGIASYFDRLDAEMATVMRVQKGYNPDPEAARQKSEYIVNFQRELICSLFLGYLSDEGLGWVTAIEPQTPLPDRPLSELPVPGEMQSDFQPWEPVFYFLLHLIPVDDLSLLMQQFRKWHMLSSASKAPVANRTKAATTDEDRMRYLLSLCIDMQSDKMDGAKTLLKTDDVRALFENTDDFDVMFGADDAAMQSTRRGLREILRFGDMTVLQPVFRKHKICNADVKAFLEAEKLTAQGLSTIAEQQKQREDLHEKATGNGSLSSDEVELYLDLVRKIAAHRRCAASVRLTNFTRAHAILMRVSGRLVDFAGTWERDLYFITLAMLEEKQQTFGEILTDGDNARAIDGFSQGRVATRRLKANFREELLTYFPCDRETRNIRNNIAHFNFLKPDIPIDLTQRINETRHLMRYDRKLKNAVSKAIADLVQREGLYLTWEIDANNGQDRSECSVHGLKLTQIDKKTIRHLETVGHKELKPHEIIKYYNKREKKQIKRAKRIRDLLSSSRNVEPTVTPELKDITTVLFGGSALTKNSGPGG
uniref:type VI-A CRISPR-associated RNA-guided ribonuclease Cas13a n=1 Tax=Pararhizobium sp. IMCC3301 TaxID=3067904 RepID=UPI00274142A1|nr:type VI-A CRISPR-associated RNA-guided ribonuclease Cas13a [Pararhizobium sp. IMCC3301]